MFWRRIIETFTCSHNGVTRQNIWNSGFQTLDIRQCRTVISRDYRMRQLWKNYNTPNFLSGEHFLAAVLTRGVQQSPWVEKCSWDSEKANKARIHKTEHKNTERCTERELQRYVVGPPWVFSWVVPEYACDRTSRGQGKKQPRGEEKTTCTYCTEQE